MHNDTLARILGQALADSDDLTLPGIEAVVGEVALHIRSLSGHDLASRFLAKVQSNSLRIIAAGFPEAERIGPGGSIGRSSDVVQALRRVESAMTGSTSPGL